MSRYKKEITLGLLLAYARSIRNPSIHAAAVFICK